MDKFCSECACHVFGYDEYFKHLKDMHEYDAIGAHVEANAVFPEDAGALAYAGGSSRGA
jgi:hypothetical protein